MNVVLPERTLESKKLKLATLVPVTDERAMLWYARAEAKYGAAYFEAEIRKQPRREKYLQSARPRDYEKMVAEAHEFYAELEDINRQLIPEDPYYSKAVAGVALSTTNDYLELGAAAAGQLRVIEVFLGGEASATAVVRVNFSRVTSQGTGTAPTAYTPEKFNTRSPAASGTYYGALGAVVTWATAQATLATNPILIFAFNAFGGSDRWVAQPGEEIYCVNAEFVSMRSASGTSVCSASVVVEEL